MTTIRFERDGAIGNIVLANPPFNRLDLRFAEALRVAVHQASESDIRVLVVRAEGPHFSFGGEVREWPGRDVNWFRTFVADVNVSYRAIETLKIPTVAVVHGIAFGGGFELALACDLVLASDRARFAFKEATVGLMAGIFPTAAAAKVSTDYAPRSSWRSKSVTCLSASSLAIP
jgi:enoyl-CoA hydratase/carnithine racemase